MNIAAIALVALLAQQQDTIATMNDPRVGLAAGTKNTAAIAVKNMKLVSYTDWRSAIAEVGAEPVVPANPTHPAVAYDRLAYRRRHRVEQLWGRLKEWRAVATRYEKTAASYLGALHVAAALDWARHGLT